MTTTWTICDDCALVAYDNGIGRVREWEYDDLDEFDKSRRGSMASASGIHGFHRWGIARHFCTATSEPELNIECHCGCRRV